MTVKANKAGTKAIHLNEKRYGGQLKSYPPDEGNAPKNIITGLLISLKNNGDHHSRKLFFAQD